MTRWRVARVGAGFGAGVGKRRSGGVCVGGFGMGEAKEQGRGRCLGGGKQGLHGGGRGGGGRQGSKGDKGDKGGWRKGAKGRHGNGGGEGGGYPAPPRADGRGTLCVVCEVAVKRGCGRGMRRGRVGSGGVGVLLERHVVARRQRQNLIIIIIIIII